MEKRKTLSRSFSHIESETDTFLEGRLRVSGPHSDAQSDNKSRLYEKCYEALMNTILRHFGAVVSIM